MRVWPAWPLLGFSIGDRIKISLTTPPTFAYVRLSGMNE